MKKLFMLAIMAVMTLTASAQLITSNRTIRSGSHNVWLDFGIGTGTEEGSKGADLNLGLRFNKMFTENIGWDIVKVGVRTNTEDFGDCLAAEALTGLRGESPVLFANARTYVNLAAGYIYGFEAEDGGFTYEIGAGLKLTPRFNVGLAYNGYKINGYKTGIIGLRLGVAF